MSGVTRKRMLYKSKVPYMSGAGVYCMNHVQGCSHGCKYPCYAMEAALRFKQAASYDDWRRPKPVENALQLLDDELASKRNVQRVHLSFTTDPLPYLPPDANMTAGSGKPVQWAIQDMTMAACEKINAHGVPVTLLTKGVLPKPLPDGKLSCRGKAWNVNHPGNMYGASVVSLDEDFRREWEPGAAPFSERLRALRELADAGLGTWVSMEPFPALKWNMGNSSISRHAASLRDAHAGLKRLLERVSFADSIVFGRWNYNAAMPCDVGDPDAWYSEAAGIVRAFCAERGIDCTIKEGTEK